MEKLFGSADLQLLGQGGAKTPVSALAAKQVVGLYFSAHWCPPCRGFTPKLADAYKKITGSGKSFEVVFVSSDKDEEQFASYFKEMPWLALPFENRDLKKALSKKFKVSGATSGIPALILLDGATGQGQGIRGMQFTLVGRRAIGVPVDCIQRSVGLVGSDQRLHVSGHREA